MFVVVVSALVPFLTAPGCAKFARWSEVWEGWSRWMVWVDKRGNFAPHA